MNKKLKELLDDLKGWINSPLDEIDKNYGIWELDTNQSKELLNYISSLKQALIDIRKMIIKNREEWSKETGRKKEWLYIQDKSVLQIIDKVLGGSDE